MTGTLYIVATPIGNLNDISHRAIQILGSVDYILAEDTRHTKFLLDRYEITTRLISAHQHTSSGKIDWITSQLKEGKQIALVTDAGTPGIADPGGMFISSAVSQNINIIPIPGASSLATILSVTNWENEPALFIGFLPKKKGRETYLKFIGSLNIKQVKTVVVFESPERVAKTFNELKNYLPGDSNVIVGRELTKQFEEIKYLTLNEASTYAWIKKGEYVLAINILNKGKKSS